MPDSIYEQITLLVRRIEKLERQIKLVSNTFGIDIGAYEDLDWKPHGPMKLNLTAQIVEKENDIEE